MHTWSLGDNLFEPGALGHLAFREPMPRCEFCKITQPPVTKAALFFSLFGDVECNSDNIRNAKGSSNSKNNRSRDHARDRQYKQEAKQQ